MKYLCTIFFIVFGLTFSSVTIFAQSTQRMSDHTPAYQSGDTVEGDDEFENFISMLVDKVEKSVEQYMKEHREYETDSASTDSTRTSYKVSAITFNGNTEVGPHDTLQGNVVVKGGTLTVYGVVDGDALVINGDIDIKDDGKILGNARAMNGKVKKGKHSVVEGYMEETTNGRNARFEYGKRKRPSYSFPEELLPGYLTEDNFLFRYNRVEGFFFGLGSEKKFYWDGSRTVSGWGSAGYGFGTHRWRLQLGLDRQFATDDALYEFGADAHSLTDSKDEWIMGLSENTITALIVQEDYRDYFQREGFGIHAGRYTKDPGMSTMFVVEYDNDRYSSLTKNTDWSLFQSKGFRNNPLIDEGIIRSIKATGGLNTVEKSRSRSSSGWNILANVEYAGRELSGDYKFTKTLVDVRRYQPLSENDQLSIRFRIGSLDGNNIVQRTLEIGGANTMPGYSYKEFIGNRMMLLNAEYRISGSLLDEITFWPGSLSLIIFADAGSTTTVPLKKAVYEGFDAFTVSSVKSDLGFGISWHDGGGRLGFAWRTDESAPVCVFLRLQRPF